MISTLKQLLFNYPRSDCRRRPQRQPFAPMGIAVLMVAFIVLSAALRPTLAQVQSDNAQSDNATAQRPSERCLAIAQTDPRFQFGRVMPAAFKLAQLSPTEVRITYATHSTYLIESADGLSIATDYAGYIGGNPLPDIVTMNRAHETHYTDFPNPEIKHVLRGWNADGPGPVQHDLSVGEVRIRNVTTAVRGWDGENATYTNSIFIFEVGGLCIGHLGHLHQELSPHQLAQIGQLDIVMVPVDGTYTLAHSDMAEVMKTLSARLILPMHYFSVRGLESFLDKLRPFYEVEISQERSIVVSQATMPIGKVLVLRGF